jgi:hypothetical protein
MIHRRRGEMKLMKTLKATQVLYSGLLKGVVTASLSSSDGGARRSSAKLDARDET